MSAPKLTVVFTRAELRVIRDVLNHFEAGPDDIWTKRASDAYSRALAKVSVALRGGS